MIKATDFRRGGRSTFAKAPADESGLIHSRRNVGTKLAYSTKFFIFITQSKLSILPERWESGLIHKFAKLAYSIRVPGVRIPPSPQNTQKPAAKVAGYFLTWRWKLALGGRIQNGFKVYLCMRSPDIMHLKDKERSCIFSDIISESHIKRWLKNPGFPSSAYYP